MAEAEAYQKYTGAAVAEMMIKVLPDVAGKIAEPLGQIDKITIIGGGSGNGGVENVAGNVTTVMAKLFESMKEAADAASCFLHPNTDKQNKILTNNGNNDIISNKEEEEKIVNLDKVKKRKKELGLTNQKLSDLSGIPLGTVNKIFSGATKYPQYDTMLALETALGMTFSYDDDGPYVSYVREAAADYGRKGRYTAADYYALPDNVRAELIDGEFYYMSAPSRTHQKLLGELHYEIKNYIRKNRGLCEVYLGPFDVFLDMDDKTVVQPDLLITCAPDKIDEKGLKGAPDFVVEIISQSTGKKDYTLKLNKYCAAGVREYWIIDPVKGRIVTYQFGGSDVDMKIWGIRDRIPVGIYEDLVIDFGALDF